VAETRRNQRRLLSRTTSLVTSPRESSNCFPSPVEVEDSTASELGQLAGKSAREGCSQRLVAPSRSNKYSKEWPSGDQCGPWMPGGASNLVTGGPPLLWKTAIFRLGSDPCLPYGKDSETAQAIVSVSGVSQKGRRLGRRLAWEEARTLLQAPNPHSIRGMRDRALLAMLVTCALRRGGLSRSAKRRLCRTLLEVVVAVRRVEVEGDESIRVVEGDGELAAEGSRAGTTWQWRSSPLSAITTARALATAIKNLQRAVKEIVDRRAGDAEILTGNFVRKKLRW